METMKKECLECDYYQMMIKGKFYPIGNWTVYKHTTPSGKVYIGITSTDSKKRWNSGYGYKKNEHFYKAIKKYGWDNIKHEILFTNFTKKMACLMERCLIILYNSFDREYGYNLTLGGEKKLGVIFTQEITNKISKTLKGKYVKENSFNRRKVVLLNNRKIFSTITSACEYIGLDIPSHITQACKNKRNCAGMLNGEWLSWAYEEDYLNMSEDDIKKKLKKARKKMVICLNTGEIFLTASKGAEKYHMKTSSSISHNCKNERRSAGKHPTTGEKLRWMSYNDYLNI